MEQSQGPSTRNGFCFYHLKHLNEYQLYYYFFFLVTKFKKANASLYIDLSYIDISELLNLGFLLNASYNHQNEKKYTLEIYQSV